MDVDDEEESQRPPVDPAALNRELDEKYNANLSRVIAYLTSHADIPTDLIIILKRSHFVFSFKTCSIR
jgi:hypothetical protein